MIYSIDVKNNNKLTRTIRNHFIFDKKKSFDKIFPYIGLSNATHNLSDIKGFINFCLKSTHVISNFYINTHCDTSDASFKNCLTSWLSYIIVNPLIFAELVIDYRYYFKLIKKSNDYDNCKLVFSSDEKQGVWDIATMSMRGIKSCQSWGTSRAEQLVGSIIDPCCGIIYLTNNNKSDHGSKMIYRSVVRYIFNKNIGPCLLLEKIYGTSSFDEERAVNILFANYLYQKTKLPIISTTFESISDLNNYSYFSIPYSSVLDENGDGDIEESSYFSYRDSGIYYEKLSAEDCSKFPSLKLFKEKFFSTKGVK